MKAEMAVRSIRASISRWVAMIAPRMISSVTGSQRGAVSGAKAGMADESGVIKSLPEKRELRVSGCQERAALSIPVHMAEHGVGGAAHIDPGCALGGGNIARGDAGNDGAHALHAVFELAGFVHG